MPFSKPIIFLLLILVSCGKTDNTEEKPPIPKISFNDISMVEGNGSITTVTIKLTLDRSYPEKVAVMFSTVQGSADSHDFEAITEKIIELKPGEVEKDVVIYVTADDIREPDESFQVKFERPFNAVLAKNACVISIKNDDTRIAFYDSGYESPLSYPGYTLSWSDEFNGPGLDPAIWTAELGDGCPQLCGWGNNELQYYTNNSNNLFFQSGKMMIEAKAESFGGKNYTSARLNTKGKKSFKFGRIDVRATLPSGAGYWPALWLLPQDNVFGPWPQSGEIDMMEYKGSVMTTVWGTLHFGNGPASTSISKPYSLPFYKVFNEEFHVFSLEWKPDEIKWYVDDVLYSTIRKSDLGANNYPFNEQFYFIINQAIGGNFPGNPDEKTIFPRWFIIDYIRVFQ